MPTLTLSIKTDTSGELVISPQELKNSYLFGVNIKNQQGIPFQDSNYEFYIRAAQLEVEQYLNIKLTKQIFEETIGFKHDEWRNWGYIHTTYPVVCPLQMHGYLNSYKQVSYPIEWVVSRKSSDTGLYHRAMYLVPIGGNTGISQNAVYSGIIPQLQYYNQPEIPFYWNLAYTTGFDKVPENILNVIGMLASINILYVAGDLILGTPGLASQSLGIDGLSQSISTTSSSGKSGYAGKIDGYVNNLKEQLPRLLSFYRGFSFTTC